MSIRNSISFITMGILLGVTVPVEAQHAKIWVDAAVVENKITPWMYGSCIEDVNHEIYGGLYAQQIFGESFEERVAGTRFNDFDTYEGYWQGNGMQVKTEASSGGKIVYRPVNLKEGSVAVDLKFRSEKGENAGLLVRVSNPGKGADNFAGYEISLTADGKRMVFGRHNHNWNQFREVPVDVNPQEWNRIRVDLKNQEFTILLNGEPVITWQDSDGPLLEGNIALRTWNSDVDFRNLEIITTDRISSIPFQGEEMQGVCSTWDKVVSSEVKAQFRHDQMNPFHGKFSQMIHFMEGKGQVGVANSGLNRWGIAVQKGKKIEGRLYLRANRLKGMVTVALQSEDGKVTYAEQKIKNIKGNWEKYTFCLLPKVSDPKARFVVYLENPGQIWVDQVVLMPTGKELFHGLPYRGDIGHAMVNQGLTFLRYGGTMVNAPEYRFKKMIGDPDRRPPYKGHWYENSTNGFGIEDFLKFCEAAGFKAAFAINTEETTQDAADMIEYLNGSVDTPWGKLRAENGHPKPYGVEYVEVGNEEVIWGDIAADYDHYIERFNALCEAIHAKDPQVKLINAAWWRPESAHMEKVFRALNGKADYWDYHPWADDPKSGVEVEKELRKMQQLFQQWDPQTTMKCAIFEENGNLHNMQRALGHATILNATRRMGDFLLTSCAANALQPYLQNDNGWDQGQVFFTPDQVWGMPPFYAQQMAAANHNPYRISSSSEGVLDVTATKNEKGDEVVLHIVNITDQPCRATIETENFTPAKRAEVTTLAGDLQEANTPEQPERIIQKKKILEIAGSSFQHGFPAHSYTIIRLSSK